MAPHQVLRALAIAAVMAIALSSAAAAAPQLPGCSSGDSIIQFVGAGRAPDANATGGGKPLVSKDCVWAGAGHNSAWYATCMQSFKVTLLPLLLAGVRSQATRC